MPHRTTVISSRSNARLRAQKNHSNAKEVDGNTTIQARTLSRVFDDDLHTKQWHNYVDYAIIGLIILSTVEVFLSTYDGIVERYGTWLKVIDYLTTFFFTIEVFLRIWCADLIDDKYKGFRGRVRYCFSFYGLIDMVFE